MVNEADSKKDGMVDYEGEHELQENANLIFFLFVRVLHAFSEQEGQREEEAQWTLNIGWFDTNKKILKANIQRLSLFQMLINFCNGRTRSK